MYVCGEGRCGDCEREIEEVKERKRKNKGERAVGISQGTLKNYQSPSLTS